jgi:hypothetical protein
MLSPVIMFILALSSDAVFIGLFSSLSQIRKKHYGQLTTIRKYTH